MPDNNTMSKVAERLLWLRKKEVEVHLAYSELGAIGSETFKAVFEDCIPTGREYFFVFNVAGKRRLVRTASVVEIKEL